MAHTSFLNNFLQQNGAIYFNLYFLPQNLCNQLEKSCFRNSFFFSFLNLNIRLILPLYYVQVHFLIFFLINLITSGIFVSIQKANKVNWLMK